MESIHFIEWCLENLNYWTITLLMAIESSFIPFPSEIVIPPAAYMAAEGEMNVFLVVFFGTLGALVGALFNYYFAFFLGRPIIYKFANSRIGRICLLDEQKVRKAENYFVKSGAISTFIGRLLPAIRQLISLPAGLAKMKITTFLLYTTLGATLWNSILAAIGYSLQSVVPKEQLMTRVHQYSSEISTVFVFIAAAIVLYFVYRGVTKPKKTSEVN
ncbi:MAG: DedA family protein [Bacteroidales bacterium]